MKGFIIRGIVVVAVFALAIIGMGIAFSSENETIVKENEEPSLPIIFVRDENEDFYNVMHGYTGEINTATISKGLSIIKEDRSIKLSIDDSLDSITNLEYSLYDKLLGIEIAGKSIMSNLKEGSKGTKQVDITFEINVPFSEGKWYELRIKGKTATKEATYFTDIIYSNNNETESHIEFAMDFSNKSYDISFKEELSWYLETKKNYKWDNDYSNVSIYDPISAIMWENLNVEKVTNPVPSIKQLTAETTVVQLKYLIKMIDVKYQYYDVVESYYLSTYNDVVYMNGYKRTLEPRFEIGDIEAKDNRINLGVIEEDGFESKYSNNGRFLAFSTSKQVWLYDMEKDTIVTLYSQEMDEKNYYISDYSEHGTSVFSVSDEGTVAYSIYGHINSGYYEGENGILIKSYKYEGNNNNTVMFIPMTDSYESIKLDGLADKSITTENILYINYGGTLYSIDIESRSSAIVVTGISEETAYFSKSKSMFAWQEKLDVRENDKISIMNLETGKIKEIKASEGERIKLIGFVKDDIVFGFIREKDILIKLDSTYDCPIYILEIQDSNNISLLKYTRENECLLNAVVSSNRISFERVRVDFIKGSTITNSKTTINVVGTDFILHSQVEEEEVSRVTSQLNSKGNEMSYYNIRYKKQLSSTIKKMIANEGKTTQRVLGSAIKNNKEEEFYVYSLAQLILRSDNLADAIKVAKENNGVVFTIDGLIAWETKKISTTVPILKDFKAISQFPELSLGCEVTALSMILNYEGFDIDKMRLANELTYDTQILVELSDREFFGDMNNGFVGSITGSKQRGHGVYHEPIKKLMSQYIPRHKVLDLTGATLDEMLFYVDQGLPVWTIVTDTYEDANENKKLQWMTARGMLEYSLEEHAVVVVGYNSAEVFVADSITGTIIAKNRGRFAAALLSFGNQALTYVK